MSLLWKGCFSFFLCFFFFFFFFFLISYVSRKRRFKIHEKNWTIPWKDRKPDAITYTSKFKQWSSHTWNHLRDPTGAYLASCGIGVQPIFNSLLLQSLMLSSKAIPAQPFFFDSYRLIWAVLRLNLFEASFIGLPTNTLSFSEINSARGTHTTQQ